MSTDLQPGIYSGIPDEQYHELPHISNSGLQLVARSPAHYFAKYRDPNREKEEDTPAKRAGKILHAAILEPETFADRFVILPPDAPRRPSSAQREAKKPSPETLFAIDWWNAWEESHGKKTIIKSEEWTSYHAIADSIRNHPELAGFLEGAAAEQTIIGQDPETGLLCKTRPDAVNELDGLIVHIDLKSTDDARAERFMRSAWDYGYFHQYAFYRDVREWLTGRPPDVHILAAFEKEPPYAVKLYDPADNALLAATRQYRKALNIVADCIKRNVWPAYSTDIETLHTPPWVRLDG